MDIKQWVNGKTLGQVGRILYFDETALASFKEQSSLTAGIVLVLVAILLQASFSEKPFYLAFLGSTANLFGALLVVYVVIKILSSESHFRFEQFLFGVSWACVWGLILMGVVVNLGYAILGTASYSFLLQVKQYYLMLMFSFSAEVFSELRGWKPIVVGLASITVLLGFSYLLG